MFPILYESITTGVVPNHYGLGVLSDCISCTVEQERNGIYELEMEYPMSGKHATDLAQRRIIKAKPNFTDDPQLFRIDRIGKVMNGTFTVYAKHISYDLSGYEITSGTAGSAVAACALLQSAASGYSITTDKSVTANFKITEPSSVRSWFGGKSGSFLDVFGTSEIKYNNFSVQFLLHAGQDRGVTIRYGKNLLELSQEMDSSNLCTHVRAFYKDEDGNITIGSKVATGLSLDVERCLIIDCSSDFEEPPTVQQLTDKATAYVNGNNLTVPSNNITLDFVQSGELENRVDLCDTVNVYYEALGITRAQVKCIRTKYDVIREKYIETEFGDAKTDIADSIIATSKEVADKPSLSIMETAIRNATELITGNSGGYVVIHDTNDDGEPDEILIMNSPDIDEATKVWRWNKNGLGYSSTGYDGTYGLAITADGAIVADFITAGTLSGNRVRTGVISSQNNQLIMDLDNGTITAPAITLNGQDVGSKLAELEQVSVVTNYALSNSGSVIPSSFPLTQPAEPTESQPYLWSKTVYTYADGDENISYGISVRGAKGQNGQDGKSFTVKGTYDTMADLIAAHPTGSAGDSYMVAGDLVVWNVDTNSWQDVGRIQGPSGFDGLWLAIENNDTGTNANVTYTAKLFKGVTDVTSDYNAVFVWQMVKESGVTEIAANTATITVTRDSADYGGTIRCICICIITEENLEDYAYSVIQDYTGNDIQIIGSNIVKLIGDTAIYKPYAIESQFQVLQDEISSRVTQTDFNSLSDTVTTQGTLIQQNANQILLKADTTTVNNALNGKMAKDMSNRSSSILIDSGQIRFDSNSIVVNSSQFTLDASGNATFGGNLTAATLQIGSEFVGIGDAISDAESGAIATAATDATNKANAAQSSAISTATATAATDAQNKADTAKNQAISTANAYTDSGLSGKVGNNEVRTKFAADIHSVTIESGTVKFKSNTLLVDSTQFTLDASGNATFKGNLSAATLVIGGSTTNIGTAINNAQSNAISAASADATTKANNAQSNAITSANNYTNTGLAGKVGNSEVRTKFAADSTSVNITSGTIAFKSNTLSIDSDNFKLTASGQATAKNFIAKTRFSLVNTSDVEKFYITHNAGTGVNMAFLNESGVNCGGFSSSANGGIFVINNDAGDMICQLGRYSNTDKSGRLTLHDSVGTAILDYTHNSPVFNTQRVYLNATTFLFRTASNSNRAAMAVGTNGGQFSCYNNDGNAVVNNFVGSSKQGEIYVGDGSETKIYLHGGTGNITCVEVTQTSSRKVKDNIKPMTDEDAEKILELEAVSFDYKDKANGTNKRGFIAEDVAEILPNLVKEETEEVPASLDYIGMIPYLVKMVQKQQAEIDILRAEIDKLREEK